MHLTPVASSELLPLHDVQKDQEPDSIIKIGLMAVGVILMIGGLIAAGVLYAYVGSYGLIACVGSVVGLISLVLSCCMEDPLSMSDGIELVDSFADQRAKMLPEQDAYGNALTGFSFIEANPSRLAAKQKVFLFMNGEESTMSPMEKRAMGIMLGMAYGDSVGAFYETLPFQHEAYRSDQQINRLILQEGQWTDDTSMGLCLADVLIHHQGLDGVQLMWAFLDWWEHGYNNAFAQEAQPRNSVGLGGNIELAFKEFSGLSLSRQMSGQYVTRAGDPFTNGNGSLMRLGPVAIIAKTEEQAMMFAWEQSKVTHQGDEAAACCQLMAFVLFHALHSPTDDVNIRKKELLAKLTHFRCSIPSVNSLALSKKGVKNPQTGGNENWNWRDTHFTFHPSRIKGFAGGYAMDALAMALHCVFTTETFEQAVLKAATRGGDSDTVGAIAGQIAGAIYGVDALPKAWTSKIQQWDRGGEIATRAYLLCHTLDQN